MKKILLLIFCFLQVFCKYPAQTYEKQRNQIFAYNMLFNGFVCGISAISNKGPNDRVLKTFLINFGRGSLGGLIKYSAKSQTFYLRDERNTWFAPLNRAYYFLGHSISMNAALNKKILSTYYCDFYGMDFELPLLERSKSKAKVRVSLGTIFSTATFFFEGAQLDFFKSLEYGVWYFYLNDAVNSYGAGALNALAIKRAINGVPFTSRIISHEIVHTYQNYDFYIIFCLL